MRDVPAENLDVAAAEFEQLLVAWRGHVVSTPFDPEAREYRWRTRNDEGDQIEILLTEAALRYFRPATLLSAIQDGHGGHLFQLAPALRIVARGDHARAAIPV